MHQKRMSLARRRHPPRALVRARQRDHRPVQAPARRKRSSWRRAPLGSRKPPCSRRQNHQVPWVVPEHQRVRQPPVQARRRHPLRALVRAHRRDHRPVQAPAWPQWHRSQSLTPQAPAPGHQRGCRTDCQLPVQARRSRRMQARARARRRRPQRRSQSLVLAPATREMHQSPRHRGRQERLCYPLRNPPRAALPRSWRCTAASWICSCTERPAGWPGPSSPGSGDCPCRPGPPWHRSSHQMSRVRRLRLLVAHRKPQW